MSCVFSETHRHHNTAQEIPSATGSQRFCANYRAIIADVIATLFIIIMHTGCVLFVAGDGWLVMVGDAGRAPSMFAYKGRIDNPRGQKQH